MRHQYIGSREDTVAGFLAAAPGIAFLSNSGSHSDEQNSFMKKDECLVLIQGSYWSSCGRTTSVFLAQLKLREVYDHR